VRGRIPGICARNVTEMFLLKDELMKLLEHTGTLRRGLRGTPRGKVFVCGGFGSQFVVVIIRIIRFVQF
jgi:hypothetical protein